METDFFDDQLMAALAAVPGNLTFETNSARKPEVRIENESISERKDLPKSVSRYLSQVSHCSQLKIGALGATN